jgi:hypothetical protein
MAAVDFQDDALALRQQQQEIHPLPDDGAGSLLGVPPHVRVVV